MKHALQKTAKCLDTHPHITGYLLLIICLLFFFSLHANTVFPDPDSFYHIKIAELMLGSRGVITEFPWLPLTILPDIFADQGWLYHALLIPFTFFSDPLVGLKVATTLLSTILFVSFFVLLKKLQIKHAWAYPLLLLVTNPFIFRISLAKTTAISVTLYLIGLYCILKQKHLPLFVLMIFFVWTHAAWPLLIIAAGVFWAVSGIFKFNSSLTTQNNQASTLTNLWLLCKATLRAPERKTFLTAAAGAVAGLAANPTFPENLKFFWYQTVLISVRSFKNIIEVGNEWYGFDPSELIGSSVFIAILGVLALALFAINFKKQTRTSWTLLIVSAFLFYLTLKSRRNSEYLLPTTTLLIALIFSTTPKATFKLLTTSIQEWIRDHKAVAYAVGLFLVVTIPTILVRDTIRIHGLLGEGFPLTKYHAASIWIEENIPPESVILHTGWEDFPILFYYSSDYRYITGLDPTFLYLASPDTHTYWIELVAGEKEIHTSEILHTFGATTFLVEKDHEQLKQKLDQHIDWTRSYEDSEVWIYTSSQAAIHGLIHP